MQSTAVGEWLPASSSETTGLPIEPGAHGRSLLSRLYARLISYGEPEGYVESHVAEWTAQLERERRSALRAFLRDACRQAPLVQLALARFDGETVDIVFVVGGNLYQGETEALAIMPRVRRSFANYYFDVMVLPASDEGSIASWRAEREILYERLPSVDEQLG